MRDINKELEDYKKITANRKRADFTASDLQGIYDHAKRDGHIDVIRAISDALCIGYSVGYRSAQRAK